MLLCSARHRQLNDFVIQEGRARFKTMSHAGSVHLYENVLRQIDKRIGVQHAIQIIQGTLFRQARCAMTAMDQVGKEASIRLRMKHQWSGIGRFGRDPSCNIDEQVGLLEQASAVMGSGFRQGQECAFGQLAQAGGQPGVSAQDRARLITLVAAEKLIRPISGKHHFDVTCSQLADQRSGENG